MKSFAITDIGLNREYNEDYYFRSDEPIGHLSNLYIVADGMGGHNAGDVASKEAVTYMVEFIKKSEELECIKLLSDATIATNKYIYEKGKSKPDLHGMGTTLVVCTIREKNVYIANVGDSRLYRMQSVLSQVTLDHSMVEELYRSGNLTEKERDMHPEKNIITRAIGATNMVLVDTFRFIIEEDDKLMMCTDGLTGMLEHDYIQKIMQGKISLEKTGELLIRAAIDQGGADNITIILINKDNEVVE